MKTVVRNGGLALSVAFVGFAAWRGSHVAFENQWPLYEALRNTAAIIFAVIGAWLAIVYPERLKVSIRGAKSTAASAAENDASRVVTLMAPIVHSTFILAAVLLVGIVAPLIKDFEVVRSNVEFFRGLSYAILTSLTLWQLWTVVLTLVPASDLTASTQSEIAVRATAANVLSGAQRAKKDDAPK